MSLSVQQEPPSKPVRKRGAPLGNTNNLKHGYYSSRFKKGETDDLEGYEFSGLQDEIVMMRVLIRRVVERSGDVENLAHAVSLLRAMSLASISLTRLIRTHHWISQTEGGSQKLLNEALSEVIEEMNLASRFASPRRK
jgi:hypothetical protein